MKVVQINATCGKGSTGKICVALSKLMSDQGIENYILYSLGESDYPLGIRYMHSHEVKIQALWARILGNYGFNAVWATSRLLRKLEKIQPDVVHLHNLHSHNCNLEMLFSYLKEKKIRVLWTFHDCWAFTGYCTHFMMENCEQWRTGCSNCPQRCSYSWFLDRSKSVFERKRQCLSGLDMTIVTPSHWLAGLVKESFLKEYPVRVIHNGIDLKIFQPVKSDFREKYGIPEERKILLGVSFGWGNRKGLDIFVELAKKLNPEKYQIVLVGTNDQTDKLLPKEIISIHKTNSQRELAEIYTAADIFLNPTREDNYPTVNMEAIACGTPVITFRTGGSPESIAPSTGVVVDCESCEALILEISRLIKMPEMSDNCVNERSRFDQNHSFIQYLPLYLNNENWE